MKLLPLRLLALTYDAYGNRAGSTRTRYGYTGRERDPLTSLLYYRARFYDPQLGRFLSEDPIALEGGINLYAYVENNPLNMIDPFGLDGLKLPNGPAGLPSDWKPDPTHPYGKRFRHPKGDILDFHPKNPLKSPKTWGGKDHWHHNEKKKHLNPGDEIPDPNAECEPQPEKPEPIPFVPMSPRPGPIPRPFPWWQRIPVPRIPVFPIMINPCIVVPDFPGCPRQRGTATD